MIISVFIPHGGCPERCTFCDQSVSGGEPLPARRVVESIEAHLTTGGRASEIAFYGGTFTALSRERQLAYLEAAAPFLAEGRIEAVRVATRPDALDREWLGLLRDRYRLKTVELGAQSFNPNVLSLLGRSHSPDDVRRGVALLRELGLKAGLHLMVGCPGESAGDDEAVIEELARLKPDTIRIHPLLVLKGTPLEAAVRAGEFAPLGLEAAVERLARLVGRLEAEGLNIIRLGLQPNELLGQAVVAGAYHPSLGPLVRSRMARNTLEQRLKGMTFPAHAALELRVPQKLESDVKGQGKSNLEWLRQIFNLSSVRVDVVQDQPSTYGEIEVRFRDPSGAPERWKIESSQSHGG